MITRILSFPFLLAHESFSRQIQVMDKNLLNYDKLMADTVIDLEDR